jgi:hypothetical protein
LCGAIKGVIVRLFDDYEPGVQSEIRDEDRLFWRRQTVFEL